MNIPKVNDIVTYKHTYDVESTTSICRVDAVYHPDKQNHTHKIEVQLSDGNRLYFMNDGTLQSKCSGHTTILAIVPYNKSNKKSKNKSKKASSKR